MTTLAFELLKFVYLERKEKVAHPGDGITGTTLGVPVADALSPDGDVHNGVEIAHSYGFVNPPAMVVDYHQVGIQRLWGEEPETNITGPGEVLQSHRGFRCPGTAIDQGGVDLSVLQRGQFGIFRSTDNLNPLFPFKRVVPPRHLSGTEGLPWWPGRRTASCTRHPRWHSTARPASSGRRDSSPEPKCPAGGRWPSSRRHRPPGRSETVLLVTGPLPRPGWSPPSSKVVCLSAVMGFDVA